MSASIREQIAAKRLEVRNSPARPVRGKPAPIEVLEDRTVDGQIERAVRTGKLDLTNLALPSGHFPASLYTSLLYLKEEELSNPPPKPDPLPELAKPAKPNKPLYDVFGALVINDGTEETDEHVVFATQKQEERVDPEELLSLKAPECGLRGLEIEMGLFGGLKTLDLHGNELTDIPDAIADLLQLTFLDLSNNKLTALPAAIQLLPQLETVNLSYNSISVLDLSNPTKPSEEGQVYGSGFLVSRFDREARTPKFALPAVRSLNLAHNAIAAVALESLAGKNALKIRVLTLSHNKLAGTLDAEACGLDEKRMPELQSLLLGNNPFLNGVSGILAPRAALDTEGCAWGSKGGFLPAETSSPTKTAGGAKAPEPPVAAYVPAPGGPTDVPEPTLTVPFVTRPAATFDSEPLSLLMDVYLPPKDAPVPAGGNPVVIWYHGGGLLQGNKENLPPHLRRLPSRKIGADQAHTIVISPNYRLAPQAPILDILDDTDASITFVRTKLADKLAAAGYTARPDPARIVLSGGSAGGYLALMAGLPMPPKAADVDVGGYRGPTHWSPRAVAPFYPISDLTHKFWATETNPVPWWGKSVPDSAARPFLNPRDAPVQTAVSGGPRSVLYAYMLQHGLFPGLLFANQRSRGAGLDGFRPTPATLSVTHRLALPDQVAMPPVYLVYGSVDDKINPLDDTVPLIKAIGGEVEVLEGADHMFDEDPVEQCPGFYAWLDKVI